VKSDPQMSQMSQKEFVNRSRSFRMSADICGICDICGMLFT
jgi:hypothetical protein